MNNDSQLHKAFVDAVSASEIDPVPVFIKHIDHEPLRKVEGLKTTIADIAVPEDSRLERIFDAVLTTLEAENELGRYLGYAKNIAAYLIPIMKPIDALTDEITQIINNEAQHLTITQNTHTMSKSKAGKKRWWGIAAAVIGVIIGAFGITADPSFLADGFQWGADFEMLVAFILAIVGWAVDRAGNNEQNEKK